MTEECVNFIFQHSVLKATTVEEIAEATSEDCDLKSLGVAIRLNKWHAIKKPFNSCKEEFTIGEGNIIL